MFYDWKTCQCTKWLFAEELSASSNHVKTPKVVIHLYTFLGEKRNSAEPPPPVPSSANCNSSSNSSSSGGSGQSQGRTPRHSLTSNDGEPDTRAIRPSSLWVTNATWIWFLKYRFGPVVGPNVIRTHADAEELITEETSLAAFSQWSVNVIGGVKATVHLVGFSTLRPGCAFKAGKNLHIVWDFQ